MTYTLAYPSTRLHKSMAYLKSLGPNLWKSGRALYQSRRFRVMVWVMMAVVLIGEHTCFRVNMTASLPYPFWFGLRGILPQKGQFVLIQKTTWGGSMLKQVTGVEGDRVHRKGTTLLINDKAVCEIAPPSSKGALSLEPIQDLVIPRGYVFVSTSSPQGFDSRYKAFGLISVLDCQAVMAPIITSWTPFLGMMLVPPMREGA